MTRPLLSADFSPDAGRLSWLIQAHRVLTAATLLGIVALVMVLYLYQGSQTALAGRSAQILEQQAADLRRSNNLLEQKIADGQSLTNIQSRADTLGRGYYRPKPDQVEYLSVVIPAPTPTPLPIPTPLPPPPETMSEALWLMLRQSFSSLVLGESDAP